MKKILLVGLLLINCFSLCLCQEYCENFKIVSILDFPPSPLTPGGNYFLLLLTVEEDNPNNATIYTDLFFVDEHGDTISVPTGPSSHLPIYSTDTIPYILKLNPTSSNQDFPTDFNGKLVIIHPSNPICEVNFSNVLTSISNINDNNEVVIYPNPFVDDIKIKSGKHIDKILIFNSIGRIVETYYPELNSYDMNLERLSLGEYFVVIQFVSGKTLVHKILKM